MLRRCLIPAGWTLAMPTALLGLLFVAGCTRNPDLRKEKYFESGKRYEANGKYREALIQFYNALKVNSQFANAHYELAKTYLKMNNLGAAFIEFQKTVNLDPTNLDARVNLGNLFVAGHALDQAEDQANAALAQKPDYADAFALLAAIDQKRNDSVQALRDMNHAISIDPSRAIFYNALAMLETADDANQADVTHDLQKATALDPHDATPHMLLAALLEKQGDVHAAEEQLIAARDAEPKNLQARTALAGIYLRTGESEKSEQTLREAIDVLPDSTVLPQMLEEFYDRAKQWNRGAAVFQDLCTKYPANGTLATAYARILYEKQDYAKSAAVVKEWMGKERGNIDLQVLNARLLLVAGKNDDALELLRNAVKDNPNSYQGQVLLAEVLKLTGDVASAETDFRKAAKINPDNMEAAAGLVDIAMRRQDFGMLSQIADETVKKHPYAVEGYLWRAAGEAHRNEWDKAAADYEIVLASHPNNPTADLELGQIRVKQGRLPEGEALIQKALDNDPGFVPALELLVRYDLQAGQLDKAVARVDAQIKKSPGNARFYTDLALLRARQKDYKGVLESAGKAIQLDPSDLTAERLYAQTQLGLGDIDSAIASWRKWLVANPNDSAGLETLGALEEAKGQYMDAESDYRKAIRLNPDDANALNNLAYLMAVHGEAIDVALSMAQSAHAQAPDSQYTTDTLAYILYLKEDFHGAFGLLDQALKNYPNDPSINLHLGMVCAKLKQKTNARTHLEKAIELAPNTQIAKDAMAELQKLH